MAAITCADQRAPENPEAHYTPLALARRLLTLVPTRPSDHLFDPAAGRNKVFYRLFPGKRSYCEIDEGTDFLAERFHYDWAITNPPYHLLWSFVDKTSQEARTGFAFLVNINGINSLTPRRLALLRERGFCLRRLHVCTVKRWFGRYYFLVFQKQLGECEFSWDAETWD